MGGKACKLNCCGCCGLGDSKDDIPSSLSQPFYRDPPRRGAGKKEDPDKVPKKSRLRRPKFFRRKSKEGSTGGKKKPKNGSKRGSLSPGVRVQYSKIPDQDSADFEVWKRV